MAIKEKLKKRNPKLASWRARTIYEWRELVLDSPASQLKPINRQARSWYWDVETAHSAVHCIVIEGMRNQRNEEETCFIARFEMGWDVNLNRTREFVDKGGIDALQVDQGMLGTLDLRSKYM